MTNFVFLVLGAGMGAALRYYVSLWAAARFGATFPYGTLIVNIAGSVLLGFFLTLTIERFEISPALRLLVATGLCGSLTTFSTFSYETVELLNRGSYIAGVLNAFGSLALGLVGVVLGNSLARAL